jgi:hypothetical protein
LTNLTTQLNQGNKWSTLPSSSGGGGGGAFFYVWGGVFCGGGGGVFCGVFLHPELFVHQSMLLPSLLFH